MLNETHAITCIHSFQNAFNRLREAHELALARLDIQTAEIEKYNEGFELNEMETEILKDQVQELRSEIRDHFKSQECLRLKFEDHLQIKEDELVHSRARCESLEGELATTKAATLQFRSSTDLEKLVMDGKHQDTTMRLQIEIDELRRKNKELDGTAESLSSLRKQLDEAHEENNRLEAELKELSISTQSRIHTLQEKHGTLVATVASQRSEIVDLKHEISRHEFERTRLVQSATVAENKLATAANAITQLQDRLAQSMRPSAESDSLQSRIREQEEEITKLVSQKSADSARIAELETRVTSLQESQMFWKKQAESRKAKQRLLKTKLAEKLLQISRADKSARFQINGKTILNLVRD